MLPGMHNANAFFSKEGFTNGTAVGNYNEAFTGTILDKEAFTVDQLDDLSAQLANDLPADENLEVPPANATDLIMSESDMMPPDVGNTDDADTPLAESVDLDDVAVDAANAMVESEEPNSSNNDMATDDNAGVEGFAGSRVMGISRFATLLKAMLMALLFYVLSHPRTYKIMTPVNRYLADNVGIPKEIVHSIVFFLVAWIVYMA